MSVAGFNDGDTVWLCMHRSDAMVLHDMMRRIGGAPSTPRIVSTHISNALIACGIPYSGCYTDSIDEQPSSYDFLSGSLYYSGWHPDIEAQLEREGGTHE